MGSQLIKGYTIEKQSKGVVGAYNNWKLYDATKQGSNEVASVLIVQKKSLPKSQKQEIIKNCKKEATSLVKFRHPYIISITEAFLEDEHSMGFVTERVEGNLKLLIQNGKFIENCSSELELKIHILQIIEALNFLHNSVKIVHLGINLNNIYITADGKWKLGGFVFSQNLSSTNTLQQCQNPPTSNNFSYVAPEVATLSKCSYSSDTFSLMIVALQLLEYIKKSPQSITSIINAKNKSKYETHKQIFMNIDKYPFISSSSSPTELGRLIKQTLAWNFNQRIPLSQVQSCQWFTDNFIITIKHLGSIINFEQKMQLQFLKGLSGMVLKFQPSLIKKRIVPALLQLMKFDYLIAGILLTILELMKKEIISIPQFQKTIWGPFKNLTQGKEISAHALYLFVNNIEIFAKFVSLQDLNTTIVPLYIKCFDCPNKLKQLALRKVQFLSKKLQYQYFKSKVLPKILLLFSDKTQQIRKLALICVYKSAGSYDSQVITDQILPALDKLRKAGSDSFNNALTLQLYSVFSVSLPIDIIGNKIIPSLVPYLVDSSISNNDFQNYKNAITNLINKIQEQRIKTPNMNEGQVYTVNDFDFPPEEKEKDIIKTQVQPNFDFLSMFKPQGTSLNQTQTIQRVQSPQISSGGLDFGGNNFQFNAFSAPIQQTNKIQSYTAPVIKQQPTNNYNYGMFQPPKTRNNYKSDFKIEQQEQKSLNAAADQFFNFLEQKPKPKIQVPSQPTASQINQQTSPKPKYTLKGPGSSKPIQISPPKQSINISPHAPSQSIYTMNSGFKNEIDPFANLGKDGDDFGDFSKPPQSNNLSFQPLSNNFQPQPNLNFDLNLNTFQAPTTTQNNFNINSNFFGTNSQAPSAPKNSIKMPPNTTKTVNDISGDSFFDLL